MRIASAGPTHSNVVTLSWPNCNFRANQGPSFNFLPLGFCFRARSVLSLSLSVSVLPSHRGLSANQSETPIFRERHNHSHNTHNSLTSFNPLMFINPNQTFVPKIELINLSHSLQYLNYASATVSATTPAASPSPPENLASMCRRICSNPYSAFEGLLLPSRPFGASFFVSSIPLPSSPLQATHSLPHLLG